MAGLKEVRSRIVSVKSTRQITQAMKMVSAAKLKRAQNAIVQMRPYANKLQTILSNVSSTLEGSESPYSRVSEGGNTLVVAVSSNRGLCGAFNNNIIKATRKYIDENPNEDIKVLGIGKKTHEFFAKTPFHAEILEDDSNITIFDSLSYEKSQQLSGIIMEVFTKGTFDKVLVVYNQFKNAAIQFVQTENYLPMQPVEDAGDTSGVEYIFNPSKEEIVTDLIPKSLHLQLYKAILDSHASEHGARMTAMHKATDNASDLLKELQLTYNKARQAAITTEILEIVGGAEALNN